MSNILAAILCAALLGCAGCTRDQPWKPLAAVADRFIAAAKAKDLGAVRASLDDTLQTRLGSAQLDGFITMTGLAQADALAWTRGSIAGERGTLWGEYRRAGSEVPTPVRLDFRQQEGAWRIQGIQRGVRIRSPRAQDVFVPYEQEARKLVTDTTIRFAEAVAKRDLAGFWASCPEQFRRRHDEETFVRTFGGFVEQRVNLMPTAKLAPRFSSAPILSPDGILRLVGSFATQPSRIDFDYEYMPDQEGWALAGIRLAVTPEQAR